MDKLRKTLAVIMQRRETRNRWESVQWQPWAVVESPEPAGSPRLLVSEGGLAQWLHPGFKLDLRRDEAEGYYLNLTSGAPSVFVLWRMEEDVAIPVRLTASYNEGARWLDAGHSVDIVPMPAEVTAWLEGWVQANYRPEPRKRIRPRSFMDPKDRAAQ